MNDRMFIQAHDVVFPTGQLATTILLAIHGSLLTLLFTHFFLADTLPPNLAFFLSWLGLVHAVKWHLTMEWD